MNATFERFILNRDSEALANYLDNYATSLNPDLLNSWFHQAARLPGNWETDRNAWLQGYYEKYVPSDVRHNVTLTDSSLFPPVLEGKTIPPTPAKDQQRTPRLPYLWNCPKQAPGQIWRSSAKDEIIIIQSD